jgi:dipeptidase E
MSSNDVIARESSGSVRLLLLSSSHQYGYGYLEHAAAPIAAFLGDGVQRVTFVPYALADWDGYADAANTAFKLFGYELESLHSAGSALQAVSDAQAFFVGGGNTFRLLMALQDMELLAAIADRARSGVPYMGASAGSNIACPTIKTTNDMPIVQPRDFHALDLLPFQINAHYLDPDPDSKHQGETREQRIAEFHEENTVPVLGLREGTWLHREGACLTLHGATGARLFQRGEAPREISKGTDLSTMLTRG